MTRLSTFVPSSLPRVRTTRPRETRKVNIAGARCIRVSIMTHQTLYTHMGVSCRNTMTDSSGSFVDKFGDLFIRRCGVVSRVLPFPVQGLGLSPGALESVF